jgi:hypothetical protein
MPEIPELGITAEHIAKSSTIENQVVTACRICQKQIARGQLARWVRMPTQQGVSPKGSVFVCMACTGSTPEYTTQELRARLMQRETAERNLALHLRTERWEALKGVLTEQLLNVLLPEHGRTSCSDVNLGNGLSDNGVRCTRCALLELIRDEITPESLAEANIPFTIQLG